MQHAALRYFSTVMLMLAVIGVATYVVSGTSNPQSATPRPTIIINLTSNPEDVFAVTQALRLADDGLAQGRRVVLFLNQGGVRLALQRRPNELKLGTERSQWVMLQELAQAGVQVIVCGESAFTLNIFPGEFIPQAVVAQSGKTVLAQINSNTVVFTY